MRKLLIISPEYSQIYAGVASYVRKLGLELSKHMEVDVLTTADAEAASYKQNENLVIHKNVKRWDIFGFIKIMNFIRRSNYDFINIQYVPHIYGWNGVNFSLFFFYFWLWFSRRNVFTYCHEVALPFSFKYWHRFPFAAFNRLVYCFIVLFSKRVGLSVKSWRDKSAKIFFWLKDKFVFMPVFSNIKLIKLAKIEKQNLKVKFNINEDETILFFMGGFNPSKLINYVLATLDYLLKKGHKIKLICAGFETENVFSFLRPGQGHLKDRIIATGLIPEETLAQLLNITDIYLCPYTDGISTRRGSAMAGLQFGLPVVSTYGVNTDMQIFANGRTALLSALDAEEFAQKIEWLLNDRGAREKLGNAAKEFYENNFNLDVVVNYYISNFLKN